MICSLIIERNKGITDILEFYKKASNTANVDIDYDLSVQFRTEGHRVTAISNLMLSKGIFPKFGSPQLQLKKIQ